MPHNYDHHTMVYGWCFSTSCFSFIASFTIMPIVSMIIMLGFYRPSSLVIGPNASILIHLNPLFVQLQSLESNSGVMLYGTHGIPPLDIVTKWTETHNVTLQYESHKKWKYYLNRGSELTISYYLSSQSSPIVLVIAEENEDLPQRLVNPTDTDTILSWNLMHGTGIIRQSIFMSSSYYVALSNLHEEVKVELKIKVKASLYNTTNSYYKCALTSSSCNFSTFYDADAAVLVSPGSQQNSSSDVWYVKLSYGPRWVTYMYGTGEIPLLMFLASYLFNKLCHKDSAGGVRYEETARAMATAPQTAPLISQKDSDCSSLGSSYESIPHDEKDLEFLAAQGSVEEKFLGDGDTSSSSNNNTWHLCAIFFDAPRNCFFLPCGHCVACFACGTRIAEEAGTCPVCRRKMKKVRKIFTI